jgi:hypothetical protein
LHLLLIIVALVIMVITGGQIGILGGLILAPIFILGLALAPGIAIGFIVIVIVSFLYEIFKRHL